MGLKVSSSVPHNARIARKRKNRNKNAVVYDPRKPNLEVLHNDLLYDIYKRLDVPSRVCLGLTNKFFARMSGLVNTNLNDRASVVRFRSRIPRLPDAYANHISDRRILMLQLQAWMPRGMRLCWVCCKFSRVGSRSWFSTSQIRFWGCGHIEIHALNLLKLDPIYCHRSCLPAAATSGRALFNWTKNCPGAETSWCSRLRYIDLAQAAPNGEYVYEHLPAGRFL